MDYAVRIDHQLALRNRCELALRERIVGPEGDHLSAGLFPSVLFPSALGHCAVNSVEGVVVSAVHVEDSLQKFALQLVRDLRTHLRIRQAALFFNSQEALEQLWDFFLHRGVPVVLDGVVSSTSNIFGDLGPTISVSLVMKVQQPLFLFSSLILSDRWIQMVVPSLPALLPDPARKVLSDEGPF